MEAFLKPKIPMSNLKNIKALPECRHSKTNLGKSKSAAILGPDLFGSQPYIGRKGYTLQNRDYPTNTPKIWFRFFLAGCSKNVPKILKKYSRYSQTSQIFKKYYKNTPPSILQLFLHHFWPKLWQEEVAAFGRRPIFETIGVKNAPKKIPKYSREYFWGISWTIFGAREYSWSIF